MKKQLIILLGTVAFACGNNDNTTGDANLEGSTTDESVEIGSGEEISPQLEIESDSTLGVDTVSAESIEQETE